MAIKKKLEKEKEKKENAPSKRDYQVLLEPVVTEKAATVGTDNASGLVMKVDRKASKLQIKESVQRIFNVEVASIRTCNYKGKLKRSGRSMGHRAQYKKAYITLKPGHEVDLFEGL